MGKADLHLHTAYSDGQPSVPVLLDAVAALGDLTVIAVTDHDTIAGAEVARRLAQDGGYPFEVIVGEEVTTRDGHLVGLFLERAVPPGLSAAATVDAIHAQGGLAFAPHPFFDDRPRRDRRPMAGVGGLLRELPVDAVEAINGAPFLGRANRRARRFAARHRLPALGCSDAHIACAAGKGYTRFAGRTAADLRRAILLGAVMPGAQPYTARELLAYWRYWRHYARYDARPTAERAVPGARRDGATTAAR